MNRGERKRIQNSMDLSSLYLTFLFIHNFYLVDFIETNKVKKTYTNRGGVARCFFYLWCFLLLQWFLS